MGDLGQYRGHYWHRRADAPIAGGVVKVPDRDHFNRVHAETLERLAKDGPI